MEKKNFIQRMRMSIPEIDLYAAELRKKQFAEGKSLGPVTARKFFSPIFHKVLTADRAFRRQKITILGENPRPKGQVIYACSHIWENDLENISEVIQKGAWLFIGDPLMLYQDFSGLMLWLNGRIFTELSDREDCHIAYHRAVELLLKGGSLMIFPEGARNGTPNLPMMPLFQGTARMSMTTGVPIIPVAVEEYSRRFYIKFGQALLPEKYADAAVLTEDIRNAISTEKWKIWETQGVQRRSDLPEGYEKYYREEFIRKLAPWDTWETMDRSRYHTKEEMEQRAVESHLEKVQVGRDNAFLARYMV